MNTVISPWENAATRESPDGRYIAFYSGEDEICMGGPPTGTLKIRRKEEESWMVIFPHASASFIWSEDSRAIAVPQWTQHREHQLCVIRIPKGETIEMRERYRVLQLESFRDGMIEGIDSPIHKPEKFSVIQKDTSALIPVGASKKPWWKAF